MPQSPDMLSPAPDERAAFRHVVLLAAGITALRLLVLWIGGMPLYLDEAQYWFWAQEPAFGYFSKPPLIAWAIAATTALCGDGAACVKAASPLAYGIAPVFAYLLARNLFGTRTGFLAALAFATLPGVAFSGFIISTDPLLLAAWLGALWAFERALTSRAIRWWLLAGLFLGVGMLAKYAMAYFIAPAAIVALLQPKGRRPLGGLLAMVATGFAVLSPNLVWNALSGFETFKHTAANASGGAGKIGNLSGVFDFLGDQVAILGPVFALVLVALLVRPRGIFRDAGFRLLAWFSLPILGLLVIQAFLSRAHGNWAAVAFPALAILIVAALVRLDHPRLLRFALWFHGGAFAVLALGLAFGQVPFLTLSKGTDPFRWIRGWDVLAAEVETLRTADSARPRAILTTDRAATAELIYHLRDSGALIRRRTEPGLPPEDHFAMVLDPADARGCDAVIVSRGGQLPPEVAADFLSVGAPVEVRMRPYADPKGTYYLFIGRGFGGVEDDSATCRSITRTGRPL